MKLTQHTLTLYGENCRDGKPSPEAIAPFLSQIIPLVRDNIRLAFFKSSRIKGRPYRPLQRAWEIRFSGISAVDTIGTQLVFEVPTLGDAAPQLYEQTEMWDDTPSAEETGLDLLGYTLSDIHSGNLNSNRFDLPLLYKLEKLKKVFKSGVSRMELGGHHLSNEYTPPPVSRELISQINIITSRTPSPKRARVQGGLDMVRCSDRVFEVLLENSERLRAVWTPQDLAPITKFLGKPVTIEGEAMFRPSGAFLRLDADAIRLSENGDIFFSKKPASSEHSIPTTNNYRRMPNQKTGYEALKGNWPGDESIEELLETLAELGS